jgi:hypothetical protein
MDRNRQQHNAVRESNDTEITKDEAMDFVNTMFKKSKIEIQDKNQDDDDGDDTDRGKY